MFKFNKKFIIPFTISFFLLFVLSFSIPRTRPFVLEILKSPLIIFNFLKREITALVFFHQNYYENEKLSKQSDVLKSKLNELVEFKSENERLNKLLSLKQNSLYKVTAARVIGRDPSNWASTVIIDKGSNSGFKKGMVVIHYYGLVGRVSEVGITTSKIMLVNDSNMGVSSIVQKNRQEGLVCGSLGGSLIMKYLPKESDIAVSDVVITSGITGIFPKGLVIGTVNSVGYEFSGLSKYAVIKPAVDLNALEEVLVINQ